MTVTKSTHTVEALFAKSAPSVRATYDAILKASRALGPVSVEPKKSSIHLVRRTAFAGIAARKDSLILTVKSAKEIRGPRVLRAERTSANRWHIEIRMASPKEIDKDVRGWLKGGWELAG